MRNLTVTFCLTIAVLLSAPSKAASILYNCDFPRWSDEDGNHASKEKFAFKLAYDDITGEAVMIGNLGIEKMERVVGTGGTTFVERLSTGAVQSTTIDSDGDAVHSRHTMILGELVPSQYYGTCKKEQN